MFMPGQSPLLEALLDRVQQNNIYVRGVVSTVTASKNGDIGTVGGQVVKSGAPAQAFHDDVELPAGISDQDRPSWAETEFNVKEIHAAHLMAIVHSKVIVVDPFSNNCAVITGSHNFSDSASQKNDENLVIVRGNTQLAQAYALHINGVYDHYSWRAYLANGGAPDQIYKPLDGWKPGGSRAQELAFWMNTPVPAQSTQQGTSSGSPAERQAACSTQDAHQSQEVPGWPAFKKAGTRRCSSKGCCPEGKEAGAVPSSNGQAQIFAKIERQRLRQDRRKGPATRLGHVPYHRGF